METEANVAEQAPPKPDLSRTVPPAAEPRVKVLLLEDNPWDARLIEIMVTEAGGDWFEVEQAARLSTALQRLSAGGIGLVLSDLSVLDSQGLETFLKLHAQHPHVPIIVLSGSDDTTLAVQAVHEGAQDFLVKGQVDRQLLVRAMRHAIERQRMSDQLARYAEELRSKNAQLEADFILAREIQEIFLPQQYPTFPPSASPEQSALKFSHRYLPAASVGGDFFNVFPITETTAGVFICDVMGHGMRAALVTAIMRGLVEERMPIAADPSNFLTGINHSLHAILRRTREPFWATAFYAVADAEAGELRFANAAHPSPLLVRRGAGAVEPLKNFDPRHGPALGLFDQAPYPTCRCPAAAGDLLLLCTDGLYEVDNPAQEEYGQERLLAAVQQYARLAADTLFDALLDDVQRFSTGKEFEDDVCLLAVEFARVGD